MAALHATAHFHVYLLMMCIVFNVVRCQRIPNYDELPDILLSLYNRPLYNEQCYYETRIQCPACFPEPVPCSFFEHNITFEGLEQYNQPLDLSYQHSIRIASLNNERRVVIKNVNRAGDIREVLESICEEFDTILLKNCTVENDEKYLPVLRKQVMAQEAPKGTKICPTGDKGALSRFVGKFNHTELLSLLLMRTKSESLMIRLLSQHNIPVPSFVFQPGFSLVESYEGESLIQFYESSLELRLKIANELINAFFKLDSEVDNFRFYLTDMNPDNFGVNVLPNGVKVSFIDLNNVLILDSLSDKLNPNNSVIQHSRIDCNACFDYVPEHLCTYRYSDINLFAVCQLLLESPAKNIDKGFLHNTDDRSEFIEIGRMLQDCVYCQPPECANRMELLKNIQQVIRSILT